MNNGIDYNLCFSMFFTDLIEVISYSLYFVFLSFFYFDKFEPQSSRIPFRLNLDNLTGPDF